MTRIYAIFWGAIGLTMTTFFCGCEGAAPPNAEGDGTLRVIQSDNAGATALAVPDLEIHPELDPLKITVDHVGLVNFMNDDTLNVALEDLYAYFHLSNIGAWDQMFD